MSITRLALIVVALFSGLAAGGIPEALAGGCGCGGPVHTCGGPGHGWGGPGHGCYSPPPIYIHSRCHPGCRHCAKPRRERAASRDAVTETRAAAPVPVVASMPVFAMPLMMASVPVMPTTRAAMPTPRASFDCERRLVRLEDNVKKITDAVAELQTIVLDQTRALEKITKKIKETDQSGQ